MTKNADDDAQNSNARNYDAYYLAAAVEPHVISLSKNNSRRGTNTHEHACTAETGINLIDF